MKDPVELSRGLLRKARQDRIAMEALLPAQGLDAVCFHAQQAVEKWLKAFLAYSKVEFPYTHNLAKLIEICAGIEPAFRSLLPTVAPLTPFAVELRYDDSFWPTETVAKQAHAAAMEVFEFVMARLPDDLRKFAE